MSDKSKKTIKKEELRNKAGGAATNTTGHRPAPAASTQSSHRPFGG